MYTSYYQAWKKSAFLPNAGPFALGLDQIPKGPSAGSLASFTLSSNQNIPTNRRKTMLKYNTLTINSARAWSTVYTDMCLFVWANRIVINGIINTGGGDGGNANDNSGAGGGYGAGGGGGGGGGLQCTCPCFPLNPGSGGAGSTSGGDGDGGGQSYVCCTPYANGGGGGSGRGQSNWVDSDGYDYVNNLSLDPEVSGQPFGFGGGGASGNNGGGGGGGGGAGGIMCLVSNSITAGAAGALYSRGGEPGLNASSDLFSSGGDGGCIAILTRKYDGSLNGKVFVNAGSNGNANGNARIFQITGQGASTTFALKSFATPF